MFIAGTAAFGLPGAIASIVVAGFFYSYLNALMLRRTLGISAGEILAELNRPLCAVAFMVGVLIAVGLAGPGDFFSPQGSWWSLGVKIVVGGVVFCGALYALWRFEGRPAGIEARLRQVVSR